MVNETIITNTSELYDFLNSPTQVYGVVTAPITINFNFSSTIRKVLIVNTSNIKLNASIFY